MAKRQLIEENRERRKMEAIRDKIMLEVVENKLTDRDRALITELVAAYSLVLAQHPPHQVQIKSRLTGVLESKIWFEN